nr:cytochrome b N-terminal domain-containing protein [Nocardioides thalensis]
MESTMNLSFEVRGGLLMRQLHHWSASVMIAAVMLNLLRIFFTGAFRGPRGLTWLLWFGVLLTGMGAGLSGHVLTDDARSGASLMVMDGLLKGVPVVGTRLSWLVFQGRFPTGAIDSFYPLHVAILPATILLFLLVIGRLNLRHYPARLRGRGRAGRVVARRRTGLALLESGGLFCVVLGVLTLMAATIQVNPIWTYGPANPAVASGGGGALWYLAFLDGAQRLVPPGWELVLFGRTWTPAIFVPLAVGGLFFLTAMLYPFVERRIVGDAEHRLLARPRTRPTRTGIGVAGIVFYAVPWIAAGSDVIAMRFSLSNEKLILTLQLGLILGPILGFMVTRRICLGLQHQDREIALHGYETGRIVRSPDGRFTEVHQRRQGSLAHPARDHADDERSGKTA